MAKREMPFLRTPYNYDTNAASDESGLDMTGIPSLAVQADAESADINVIMERHARGILPELSDRLPRYDDFTLLPSDYHTCMNAVVAAQDAFDSLPAKVRAKFDNAPENLLAFLADPANRDEAVKLGLVAPKDDSPPPPEARNPIERRSEGGGVKPLKEALASVRASNEAGGVSGDA